MLTALNLNFAFVGIIEADTEGSWLNLNDGSSITRFENGTSENLDYGFWPENTATDKTYICEALPFINRGKVKTKSESLITLFLIDWSAADQKMEFQETVQRTKVYYEPSGKEVLYAEAENECNLLDVLPLAQDNIDFIISNRLSGKYHLNNQKILNPLTNRENFVDPKTGSSIAMCSSDLANNWKTISLDGSTVEYIIIEKSLKMNQEEASVQCGLGCPRSDRKKNFFLQRPEIG